MNAYPRNTRVSKTRAGKTTGGIFACALALGLFALFSNPALAQAPATVVPATAATPTEAQKIQMLIHDVEVMKDARFVRNGSDYDGAAAADHLRMKLRHAGDRIKTAENFITYLASKSSFSGQPYKIRFADGHEIDSAQFFHTRLAMIEHSATAIRPIPTRVAPAH